MLIIWWDSSYPGIDFITCSSNDLARSSVLKAIQVEPELQKSALRLSLGHWLDRSKLANIPDIIQESIYNASIHES